MAGPSHAFDISLIVVEKPLTLGTFGFHEITAGPVDPNLADDPRGSALSLRAFSGGGSSVVQAPP